MLLPEVPRKQAARTKVLRNWANMVNKAESDCLTFAVSSQQNTNSALIRNGFLPPKRSWPAQSPCRPILQFENVVKNLFHIKPTEFHLAWSLLRARSGTGPAIVELCLGIDPAEERS